MTYPGGPFVCNRGAFPGAIERVNPDGLVYYFSPGNYDAKPSEINVPHEPTPAKADPYTLDRVYRKIMSHSTLKEETVSHLVNDRGFTVGAIKHSEISTWDVNSMHGVAEQIATSEPNWQAIPGLVNLNGKPALWGCKSTGVLLPLRDLDGKVMGLKVRMAHPPTNGGKCRLLTSASKGGPSSGSPPSVWRPLSPTDDSTVVILEGELAAALRPGDGSTSYCGSWRLRACTPSNPGMAFGTSAQDRIASARQELPDQSARDSPDHPRDQNSASGLSMRTRMRIQSGGLVMSIGIDGKDDALQARRPVKQIEPEEALAYLEQVSKRTNEDVGANGECRPFEESPPPEACEDLPVPVLEQILKSDLSEIINPGDLANLRPNQATVAAGGRIAGKNRSTVLKILKKYQSPLFDLGFNINDLLEDEQRVQDQISDERKQAGSLSEGAKERLQEILLDCEFFRGTDELPYAACPFQNDNGSWRTETRRFDRGSQSVKNFVTAQYYRRFKQPAPKDALEAALSAAEAEASNAPPQTVFVRVARIKDVIYVDMCNDHGDLLEISPEGHRVIPNPGIKFLRAKGALALPRPKPGGSLRSLQKLLRLKERSFRMLVGWMVYAFVPDKPHGVLVLEGPPGSAKTTIMEWIRSFLDPSAFPFRVAPKDLEAAAIVAANYYYCCWDNLSGIPGWFSDFLCVLVTGGSFGARMLYANTEESVFSFQRVCILSGIGFVGAKPDLLDRSIKINLERITDYVDQDSLNAEFEAIRPQILWCLADAVSTGLRNRGKVPLPKLTRLADFHRFVTECEAALPWEAGGFLQSLDESREEQVQDAIENDSLLEAILDLVKSRGSWEGTNSELLTELRSHTKRELPKGPQWLTVRLRMLEDYLRSAQVSVAHRRTKSRRTVIIGRADETLKREPADIASSASPNLRSSESSKPLAEPVASPIASPVASSNAVASPGDRTSSGCVTNSVTPRGSPDTAPAGNPVTQMTVVTEFPQQGDFTDSLSPEILDGLQNLGDWP